MDVAGLAPRGEAGGPQISPLGGPCDLRPPEAPVGPLQSSKAGELRICHLVDGEPVPYPFQGVMFRKCSRCGAALPSRPTAHGSSADGLWSDDLCDPCFDVALADARRACPGCGLVVPGAEPDSGCWCDRCVAEHKADLKASCRAEEPKTATCSNCSTAGPVGQDCSFCGDGIYVVDDAPAANDCNDGPAPNGDPRCEHDWPPLETAGALRCYKCGADGDA